MRWDIFCKVIDNHGDIGVCWRLAAELAAGGESVRLWVDDASALDFMAPQGRAGVQVHAWPESVAAEPGDVVIEAFGCELEPAFVAAMARARSARGRQPAWINLEYLSAQGYVARCHGLPSPVNAGPGAGLVKYFFYPGFTPGTGGLLRERDLPARQAAFDRPAWLQAHGVDVAQPGLLISLFCYEPPALAAWLQQLAAGPAVRMLLAPGRPQAAVRALLAQGWQPGAVHLTWLPWLPQTEFDHLLWSCDLNFVRGEDSLVRALWAGRPFVWNIYPQDDGAHADKLDAFLRWLQAPPSLAAFHRAWNGLQPGPLPQLDLLGWGACAAAARQSLLAQRDLASQLASFVTETG